MKRVSKFLCRRFVASTSGLAAIEFAVIMPILLLLLLGTFDAGRAISVYMKTRSATYTLAAITNQYSLTTPIQSTDMQAITGATAAVLSPFPSSAATVTITQIKQTSATQAVVSWSYSMNGTAYGAGSTLVAHTFQSFQHQARAAAQLPVLFHLRGSQLRLYALIRVFCRWLADLFG